MVKYNKEDGVWRTIKGRHIFIRNGQSINDAIKESENYKKTKSKQSNEDKENSAFYNKLNNEDKKKYDKYLSEGYSKSDIENTLMYKTQEERMRDSGIEFAEDNDEEVIPDKLLTEAANEWKNPERQKQYIGQQLKSDKAMLKALEEHNASDPSTLSYMDYLRGRIKKYEDNVKEYPQLTRNGKVYNITEHKDEGYYKGIAANGRSFVGKSKEKYKIENPNDASDWGWIEKEEYDKLTSNGKLTDELDIARRIRQGKMVKDDSIWDDNQTYHIGKEKEGYYVQFQDVSTHEHENINKYPRVSPKVKSNTWARVWRDGEIVYNNDAGRNSTREGKYSARANVANFLEGEKSYSTLVQSYMKAGFTKAQAEAFAKYQLRRRK